LARDDLYTAIEVHVSHSGKGITITPVVYVGHGHRNGRGGMINSYASLTVKEVELYVDANERCGRTTLMLSSRRLSRYI